MDGSTILFTGPLSVVIGTIGVVSAVVDTDIEFFLVAGTILLVGLSIMVFPGLHYWGKIKPWDQSPGTDSY